jgi:MmoB/DmpM family protein
MAVLEMDPADEPVDDLVGPVLRAGHLAEAVIEAVEADNPDRDVLVLDRDDYVRIHTVGECRLTLASLQAALGGPYQLAALEIDMPSFKGRLRTRTDEYVWSYQQSSTGTTVGAQQ